ncbi:MAG: hypothetical protein WC574_06925 [Candidatus Omnitrophota bacterium]
MIIFVPLGIIASIFQLVTLREFNFSIARNELAFLAACGFWIIFCSLGSIFRIPKKLLNSTLPALIAIIFSLSICLIHLIKSLIGLKYYEATSLGLTLFLSLILIAPIAFTVGIAFRHFVREYIKNNPVQNNAYAKFFAFEAAGFFLGGVFFTLYLKNYANPLVFSLLPLLLLPGIKKIRQKVFTTAIIIGVTIISTFSFDSILKKELDNADILFNLGTGYGPVIAAQKAQTTMLFSGGSLLATSEDRSANEEFIHASLSAVSPGLKKDILFIGSALSGQIEEIIKYNPAQLDLLQINPIISKISQAGLNSRIKDKVNFITDDPRLFLKKTGKKYDAILMNMPAPANLGLNRYFTEEFFKLIALRLKKSGIFSFTIPSKREILSPQFVKFNSSITNAVNNAFANSFIIPSDSMIVIASGDKKITADYLLNNFSEENPDTHFFTIYHLKDLLNPSMRDYTETMLDNKIAANTDLAPVAFLNYLILEQTKFYPGIKIEFNKIHRSIITLLCLCGIILITISFVSKRVLGLLNIVVLGFSSISLTSIIFVLFQLYCGALFWKLGMLIALFMGGLSIGAFCVNRIKNYRANYISRIYLFWMLTVFILFLKIEAIGRLNYADFIFYLLALICGLLTGAAYPLLTRILSKNKFETENIPTTIYSMDLAGAFLGTLVCGILLIPFLGIPHTILTLVLLNAVFALRNLGG